MPDYEQALTSNLLELEALKMMGWVTDIMKKVRTGFREAFKTVNSIITDTRPYQPKFSRHAVVVALLSCLFFISFDIMRTLNDDNSILWWSMHACLLGFFYFFIHPWVPFSIFSFFSELLIGGPSYSNFSKW